uniref:SREBP regulating gene protein n=1 Tax=Cyprinus carpio TaxID=7962 RepID=A0A8C1VFW9_CYPCA
MVLFNASMVFRRLLRKRWVLGVVFGLSLIYFLSSTLKHQEERTIRDRTLLEARDSDHHIQWKIKFILGNSSRQISQCRNSIQGKRLLTDELGKRLFPYGLISAESCCTRGRSTLGVVVCINLRPEFQPLLERFLNRAAEGFQNLFTAVEDHFELCLAKCRTSSQSVQHENTYRNPQAKYCYGESPPELLPI